ncbi:MAG: effector-associated domain EAD1-containing protein [Polyangiaceae bacterium]
MFSSRRRLLSALEQAVRGGFPQGGSEGDFVLRRLRPKLDALKLRARRTATLCGVLFAVLALAMVGATVTSLDALTRAGAAAVLVSLLTLTALGAMDATRMSALIDALEELLFDGEALRPLDVVAAFRDTLSQTPSEAALWASLVEELSRAYDRPEDARDVLERAGVPLGHVRLAEAMIPLWRDALRVVRRRRMLPDLARVVLADPQARSFHETFEGLFERAREMSTESA